MSGQQVHTVNVRVCAHSCLGMHARTVRAVKAVNSNNAGESNRTKRFDGGRHTDALYPLCRRSLFLGLFFGTLSFP